LKISAVIIAKNEERSLPACLESLGWVDEVVLLDSCSTDRTREIAQAHGARVAQSEEWPGFGPQKNRAIDLAAGEWILSIDADERVTPELAAEIQAAIARTGIDAFAMRRSSSYCGRQMRHSGWWPDYVTRVFRRGRARFSEDLVHERLVTNGRVERLSGILLHESFVDLEDVLDKVNRYSSLAAEQLAATGRQGGVGKGLVHGLAAFVRTYVLRRGFLDGREGLMLAISNAEGAYYKYVKLWLKRRRAP
jgi:glycosyltransferase involved in cell wall biosynthesis